MVKNCLCITEDMAKIFEVYWYLGVPHTPLPPAWPAKYSTAFNKDAPMKVFLNATNSSVYVSVRSFFLRQLHIDLSSSDTIFPAPVIFSRYSVTDFNLIYMCVLTQ